MAYLTSPQHVTPSNTPDSPSALALNVLQQGPLNRAAFLGPAVAAATGDALTLRPDGRLQYGGTVTGGRRVTIA